MLPISKISSRVRSLVHDNNSITYDDADILNAINGGIRFIRRLINQYQPEMLASPLIQGVLDAGENVVVLDVVPTKIIDMRAGSDIQSSTEKTNSAKIYQNKTRIYHSTLPLYSHYIDVVYSTRQITEIHRADIKNISITGTPYAYYRAGLRTINFYPIPDKATEYIIFLVADAAEVDMTGQSPFVNEYDDFLIEYAATRLSMGNEFDMTQETTLMSSIYDQITSSLTRSQPSMVNGYFSPVEDGYVKGVW